MPFPLLRCLAHAIGKNGVKFLCGLAPGGEILFEIANDAWEEYRQAQQENARRAEVQSLAQASPEQVQQAVEEAVRSEAADLPDDARQKLTAYLGQVPGMIRRSLRRPSDPTGKTVPASLSLRHPEDLLPFLPPRPPRFQAGSRPLPGVPWVLEEPLGIGGFGEVWKARHAHMRNKPPVALKFCLDPSAAKVLRNEAGVLDRLMRHGRMPGIVPLLQAYLDADPPCLEYEYVEGGDLAALIREWHAQRALSAAWANWLLLQLAETIAAAHRADPAIVHDDLKPANILVQRAADRPKLYVTDYSIGGLALARAVKQTRLPTNSREQLLTETVRGAYTPLYASPQQMTRKRDEPADPRDDVHALGVIWYQLLTGDLTMVRVPTNWTDELRGRGLTEDLTRLLGACFADKAEKRPANAGILAGELRALITPSPIAPQPAPAPISSHPKTGEQKRLPQAEAAPQPKKQGPSPGKTTGGSQRVQTQPADWSATEEAQQGVPALIKSLSLYDYRGDGGAAVRKGAVEALGKIRPRSREHILAVAEVLKHPQNVCRLSAAQALGAIGPSAQPPIPLLTAALADIDESVRRAAQQALDRIRGGGMWGGIWKRLFGW